MPQNDQKAPSGEFQEQTEDVSTLSAAQGAIVTYAIVAIAVVAIFFGLAQAKEVIAPTLLAAFFAVLLYVPYSFLLKKLHLGRGVAITVIIFLILFLGLGLGAVLGLQLKSFGSNIESYQVAVNQHITTLKSLSESYGFDWGGIPFLEAWNIGAEKKPETEVSASAADTAVSVPAPDSDVQSEQIQIPETEDTQLSQNSGDSEDVLQAGEGSQTESEAPEAIGEVAEQAVQANVKALFGVMKDAVTKILSFAGKAFVLLILVIFMLSEVSNLPQKIKGAVGDIGNDKLHAITRDIQHYMKIKTIVSLIVGAATAVLLFFLNIPYCLLWAVIAFFFNYVPNIGSVVASIPPILIAFAEGGIVTGVIAVIGFVAINCIMGYVFEPRWFGDGLDISPLVVLISLLVWYATLGSTGLFLAPLLAVICKIILQQFPETEALAWLMAKKVKGESISENTNVSEN